MTIAEREREHSRLYRRALPWIVDGLSQGQEPVSIAHLCSEKTGLSERDTFRWVQATEEAVERYRRRRAVFMVVPIWIGGLTVTAASLAVMVMETGPYRSAASGFIVAGALLAFGFYRRSRNSGESIHRRWLQREEIGESVLH